MNFVDVHVTNRTTTIQSGFPQELLLPYWSFSAPNFQYVSRRYPGWDGRIRMMKYGKLASGLFWATYKDIEENEKIQFQIKEDIDKIRIRKTLPLASEKYHFQNECLKKMVSSKSGGLILNATGSGKTRIAAMYFASIKGKGLFVVDQLDLLEQAKLGIENYLGEEVGYVGNSIFDPKRITVATIQTMHGHRFDPKFEDWTIEIDAIVIDEIHVQMNRQNFDVVAKIMPPVVFGLTATLELTKKPIRLKAWSLAGPVIFEYPLAKGMRAGILARGVCCRILYQTPQSTQLPQHGAGNAEYDTLIVSNPERNSIISRLTRYAHKRGMYVIVLIERLKHMEKLSKRLSDIPHKLVAGKVRGEIMKVVERQKAKKRFEKGKVRVIIASRVFKKGIDIKRVDVITDGAALKSKNDAIQKFGRGIRTHAEKTGLLYFDIADQDPDLDMIRKINKLRMKKYRKRIKQLKREKKFKTLKLLKKPILEKPHRFHQAAGSRKRALKQAGIKILDVVWNDNPKEIFHAAGNLLKKELKKYKKTA